MELAIRNKWISLRGSSVVKDLNNNDVLRVRYNFNIFAIRLIDRFEYK